MGAWIPTRPGGRGECGDMTPQPRRARPLAGPRPAVRRTPTC